MPPERICKTIHQYSREPIPDADMEKLKEIADDYCKVKNYVYKRFGGIKSLQKIYPGYTVQNEMTQSGMREQLQMPSVYFYLAIFDALGDIKSQWTKVKSKVAGCVGKNENLTEDEKHYLRFLLKVSNVFEAVLNKKQAEKLPETIQKQYDELQKRVDVEKMHRYLCRQVRKCHVALHTDLAEGFSITERAYRYADHGIYISIKEKRKRIFIPLTDGNSYKRQLYIKLHTEENRIEIKVPVSVCVRKQNDYVNPTGIAMGMYVMLTTDKGAGYGEELGRYQVEYADWVRMQTGIYNHNKKDNPGRMKYNAKKKRMEENLHNYINHELNRFFQTEKPCTIYMAKLPKPQARKGNKRINNSVSMWQRGYIRRRLEQKCRERSVEIVEVLGKDISIECSNCGATGSRQDSFFVCKACGYCAKEKTNTAKNAQKRGMGGKALIDDFMKNKMQD